MNSIKPAALSTAIEILRIFGFVLAKNGGEMGDHNANLSASCGGFTSEM
jgi:hypothetical protein